MSKTCKCGKEMSESHSLNYVPNCGNVSNSVIYCKGFTEDAQKCFEKNNCADCADYYGCEDVRARHTPSESTGDRW